MLLYSSHPSCNGYNPRLVYFSLYQDCHQIPVAFEDCHDNTIWWWWWGVEFMRVRFGLRYAAQSFQRFINHVLHTLYFVCISVDNVLMTSGALVGTYHRCTARFSVVREVWGCDQPSKVWKSDGILQRLHINSAGISPSYCKVEAIINFPEPDTTRKLRQFLGMVNFFRRLLPNRHHHFTPSARISLTLSRHPSLSSITSGRSSGPHPVSAQSCCM